MHKFTARAIAVGALTAALAVPAAGVAGAATAPSAPQVAASQQAVAPQDLGAVIDALQKIVDAADPAAAVGLIDDAIAKLEAAKGSVPAQLHPAIDAAIGGLEQAKEALSGAAAQEALAKAKEIAQRILDALSQLP